VFAPFFACLGLALVLYPITKEESVQKYGTPQMPWKHMPLGMKMLVVIGILLGLLQWAFFAGTMHLT